MTKTSPVRRGARVLAARDIPRSCICVWDWDAARGRWKRIQPMPGCPWHEKG